VAELSDDILMSYADGMLHGAERARVARAVAEDDALARRLAVFTETGERLASAYLPVAVADVPRHLTELVATFPLSTAPAQNGPSAARPIMGQRRLGLLHTVKELLLPRPLGWAGALAYSLAFVAGAGVALLAVGGLPRGGAPTYLATTADGRISAAGEWASVLERALSTVPTAAGTLGTRSAVEVVGTFKSTSGYCRQYGFAVTPSSGFSGVACREADGRWIVKAHFPSVQRKGAAAGHIVAGEADEIRSLVEQMNKADSLSRADEAERVARGWRD
jgi:anti-sigma factor RsiW